MREACASLIYPASTPSINTLAISWQSAVLVEGGTAGTVDNSRDSKIYIYRVYEVMAYGMEQLRRAGRAIADADRAYANRVASHIDPHKQPLLEIGSAVPLADVFKGGHADSQTEKLMMDAMSVGVAGMNVASRYALPVGGVTLAGKALMDLTAYFGGPGDQQEPNQLSM